MRHGVIRVVMCSLVACGDSEAITHDAQLGGDAPDATPTGFIVSGSLNPVGGGTIPSTSRAMVLWNGDYGNGMGDYLYKHSEVTTDTAAFSLVVSEPLPTAATYNNLAGIGWLVLVPSGTTLQDGIVADFASLEATMSGHAGEYAIIYKNAEIEDWPWFANFPMGLSCGKCVFSTSGFDSFAPVACDTFQIQVGPPGARVSCNWH